MEVFRFFYIHVLFSHWDTKDKSSRLNNRNTNTFMLPKEMIIGKIWHLKMTKLWVQSEQIFYLIFTTLHYYQMTDIIAKLICFFPIWLVQLLVLFFFYIYAGCIRNLHCASVFYLLLRIFHYFVNKITKHSCQIHSRILHLLSILTFHRPVRYRMKCKIMKRR